MAEDYKLIDNEEKHRYEFQIDGKIAEIDYIKSNNGEIYLVHTEVPASLGGKGVGSQLAEKHWQTSSDKVYVWYRFARL